MINLKNYHNLFSIGFVFIFSIILLLNYTFINPVLPKFIFVVFSLIFLAIIFISIKIDFSNSNFINRKMILVILAAVAALSTAYILSYQPPAELSRGDSLSEWFHLIAQTVFPYAANVTEPVFPGLYFAALPFYLLGKIQLVLTAAMIIVFVAVFWSSQSNNELLLKSVLFLISPVIVHEYLTQSNLLFNFSLVLLTVVSISKFVNPKEYNASFFFAAIFTGLIFSTRIIFVPLFIIFLLFHFRKNYWSMILFLCVTIYIFFVLIYPFTIWENKDFWLFGPFSPQSEFAHIPNWIYLLVFGFSIVAGIFAKSIQKVFFFSGLLFASLFFVINLMSIYEIGLRKFFETGTADFSHLISCAPLFILAIKDNLNSTLEKINTESEIVAEENTEEMNTEEEKEGGD